MDVTYLAGSFYDWRDKVIKAMPSQNFADPRESSQNSIADLVSNDMNQAERCERILVGLPAGKSLPTMTYAEVGAAYYSGNKIFVVDENKEKEPLLNAIACRRFSNFDDAIKTLRRIGYYEEKKLYSDRTFRQQEKKEREDEEAEVRRTSFEDCGKRDVKRVLLLGDFLKPPQKFWNTGKEMTFKYEFADIPKFGQNNDILVVNFNRGKRDKKDIFFMGIAYAAGVPIVMNEANPIVYPPLAGLARRIFTGPERFDILRDYLTDVKSNNINSEAKVMYDLFQKYNS